MEDKTAIISVIIPIYNVELYLNKCIESVLNQTYTNLEVILVNDGSTDRSGEICDSYCKIDKRVKVIHQKNGGPALARNRGLRIAKGEYIGFIDSDDYMAEDMYETLLSCMQDDVDITCCGRICVFPKGRREIYYLSKKKKYTQEEALSEVLLVRKISSSVCTKLFRRELFEDILFPVGRGSEDVPVIYNLTKKARNITHVGKAKYFNCYREDSRSNKEFYFRKIDYLLFKRDMCIDIKSVYPELSPQAEAGYIQAAIYIVGNIRECQNRDKYEYVEKRVKRLLRNMSLRGLRNPYLDWRTKKTLIGTGIKQR